MVQSPLGNREVLLVDDHPDILKSVSRLLAFDFEIAGHRERRTSGSRNLAAGNPDIIVLDITMPGRDGFQTAQDLKRIGSRAQIVFLTMHEDEGFVAHGFRSGGRGYVLKTRLHEDLIAAIERVLSGQLFLPSLKSLLAIDDQPRHAVHFHPDEQAYIESVSGLVNGRSGGVMWSRSSRLHRSAQAWPGGSGNMAGALANQDNTDGIVRAMPLRRARQPCTAATPIPAASRR